MIIAGVIDKREVFKLFNYLKSLSSRLQSLQRASRDISKQVNHFHTDISTKKEPLINDLGIIREEVTNLREEIGFVQKTLLQIINQLKRSVKNDDFERFKKRVDLWSPEKMVTRREVEKVLREL